MTTTRVLVVEDQAAIRELIKINLQRINYTVDESSNIAYAKESLLKNQPDIILLDWMLPNTSGIKWVYELKSKPDTSHIPIIMITAKGEEQDRVDGFEAGCDDYIVKPFFPSELIARIQVLLKKTSSKDIDDYLKFGNLIINGASKRVSVNGQALHFGPLEFNLLEFLAKRPERVFSRASLLNNVWQDNVFVEERTIDVHIRRIRKVLEPYKYDKLIQTVRGSGYMFSKVEKAKSSF